MTTTCYSVAKVRRKLHTVVARSVDPEEGVEPSSPGSEPGVLPVGLPRSVLVGRLRFDRLAEQFHAVELFSGDNGRAEGGS